MPDMHEIMGPGPEGKKGVFRSVLLRDGSEVGLRWRGHAVEGAEVLPHIRLLWPICGKGDVPANAAHAGDEAPTCSDCATILAATHQEGKD